MAQTVIMIYNGLSKAEHLQAPHQHQFMQKGKDSLKAWCSAHPLPEKAQLQRIHSLCIIDSIVHIPRSCSLKPLQAVPESFMSM